MIFRGAFAWGSAAQEDLGADPWGEHLLAAPDPLVVDLTAFAPQFTKVWKTRSTEDISLGMFLLLVFGVFLWLVYGLLSGDAPLIASNAITMVLAGGILFMKLKYG